MRKISIEVYGHEVTVLVRDNVTDDEIDNIVNDIVANETVWYEVEE